jgi:CHASE3 domain sensor protein
MGATPRSAGLLADATELAGPEVEVRRLTTQLEAYRRAHERVLALESQGRVGAAANLSVGPGGQELRLADDIRRTLDRLITASQRRFETAAADARSAIAGLWIAIPLLTCAGVLLGLYGVRVRLNEYR